MCKSLFGLNNFINVCFYYFLLQVPHPEHSFPAANQMASLFHKNLHRLSHNYIIIRLLLFWLLLFQCSSFYWCRRLGSSIVQSWKFIVSKSIVVSHFRYNTTTPMIFLVFSLYCYFCILYFIALRKVKACNYWSCFNIKITHFICAFCLIWNFNDALCSGRRSSFHDRAARERWCFVLQHQSQTRNHFQPGQRPQIRSALSLHIKTGHMIVYWKTYEKGQQLFID